MQYAAPRVSCLPGFGTPETPHYAGFVAASEDDVYYYHFVTSSAAQPETRPVVMVYAGGPGCSGALHLYQEHGPYSFTATGRTTSSGVPLLEPNPNSWHQLANIVYWDAPTGAGFSYTNGTAAGESNDTVAVRNNYVALLNWYTQFPQYKSNDLILHGTSYGGVFVPTLADVIYRHQSTEPFAVPLRSFFVGNGCGGLSSVCGNSYHWARLRMLRSHQLFSEATWNGLVDTCPMDGSTNPNCNTYRKAMSDEVGNVNMYNVLTPCMRGHLPLRADARADEQQASAESGEWRADEWVYGPIACLDFDILGTYMNIARVRTLLNGPSLDQQTFYTCSPKVRQSYLSSTQSVLPLYPNLVANYRVLVYGGDVDACVPTNWIEDWTSAFAQSQNYTTAASWHPYIVKSQVVGYATEWGVNRFTFATVKGAGHWTFTASDKPEVGIYLLQQVINNERV